MARTITRKAARQRLAQAKPVYADYFAKDTGKAVRMRVVLIHMSRSSDAFTLQDINGTTSEVLTEDRVSFFY